MSVDIRPARVPEDIQTVHDLLVEYQQWLDIDLRFQDFDEELASLPGKYAEPKGQILLAWEGESVAGCIAVRPMDDTGVCEMKRLYLKEGWRGHGLGRKLTEDCLSFAKHAGYAKMRLDTERRLQTAIDMYRKFGFQEISQYYDNPLDDMLYMEKDLT